MWAQRLGRPQVVGDGESKHATHAVVRRPGTGQCFGQCIARRVEAVYRIGRQLRRCPAEVPNEGDILSLDRVEQLGRRRWVPLVERRRELLARELEPAEPRGELGVGRWQLVEREGGAAAATVGWCRRGPLDLVPVVADEVRLATLRPRAATR